MKEETHHLTTQFPKISNFHQLLKHIMVKYIEEESIIQEKYLLQTFT